ncbi:hypothetical protein GGQ88_000242 [Novosphingobium hassiacum]|uniref:Uncharacterized protein n=1 Tax=Novosphingobium hassiacum TaxID=173676 RepID=A0A7W5ZT67_9SPHN|nr:hypothetical protein [Novosphingobium hassiacum]MBB3859002.1 hypothetical protein [Novosphingobium hassiacum]
MSGFKGNNVTGVAEHVGDPHCNAAHAALLVALQALKTPFLSASDSISNSQKGNLGEFICLHIGRNGYFSGHEKFASNAIQPLTRISGAGVDLMYIYFHPSDPSKDIMYIQETKTAGSKQNINYFQNLERDYEKLFGTDINLTLQSRISYLCNSFEIERNQDEYSKRVQRLGGTTPDQCSSVRLVPTGVHEAGVGNPVQKMLAIKTAIAAFGWDQNSITPWTIGLSDLEDRLLRLARGQL